MADIIEIESKSVLHNNGGRFPWKYDLNLYRGCGHSCVYCFAKYSHRYLDDDKFFDKIYVKKNAAAILDRQLSTGRFAGEIINLGGVTDSYQPIEAELQLMPEILDVLKKHGNPVNLSTKSDLILRDFSSIKTLSETNYVQINSSITCADAGLQKILEPGASSTDARFEMLKKMKFAGCKTNVLMMPLIPYLTAEDSNIDALFSRAAGAFVDGVVAGPLNLMGSTRTEFFKFIEEAFPQYQRSLSQLYQGSFADKGYRRNLYDRLQGFYKKYRLEGGGFKEMLAAAKKHKRQSDGGWSQGSLF